MRETLQIHVHKHSHRHEGTIYQFPVSFCMHQTTSQWSLLSCFKKLNYYAISFLSNFPLLEIIQFFQPNHKE
jgi:hypothetical protein